MKSKTILLLMSIIFLFFSLSGEENVVVVELVPGNVEIKAGDTFNLTLVVKNVSEDGKCGGFEGVINYDSNILNLTGINLSEVGERADLKEAKISSGKIKVVWFRDQPYDDFILATLSFKALKPGETNITLRGVEISNEEGSNTYGVVTSPVTVTVRSLNNTVGYLKLEDIKINNKINSILSLIVAETPVRNISGRIVLSNVSLAGVPIPLDIDTFKNYSYSIENNTISFFAVPSKRYENNTLFENFLKIPLLIESPTYGIYLNLTINGESVENISIIKTKKKGVATEYGLIFYIDGYEKDEINISLGYSKEIKLKICYANKNLTDFSGYIFINNSLFNVSNYKVPEYSKIYKKINYSNITYNNSYLYFNISLKNGTNGSYSILKFTIFPKVNKNITSVIYLKNVTIYENGTKVSIPLRNLTVNIVKREKNTPPRLKVVLSIEDCKKVYFRALSYDADNEMLRYFWDFGDGKNSTSQNPTHVYSNYTIYLVSCTVRDSLNQSDRVEFILPIENISPLRSHSIVIGNNPIGTSENYNVYLNLSLKNPFNYRVMGYINFVDYYNNYRPSRLQYCVELKPKETRNLLIPINTTKSCDIKWNIVYYPLYRDKLLKNIEIKYYQWNFKEKIDISKYRRKTMEKSKVYDYINTYSKVINTSAPKMVVKIRRHHKEYIISKDVAISSRYVYPYIATSLCGFMIGLLSILTVIKKNR